jgi:uncharacterized protein
VGLPVQNLPAGIIMSAEDMVDAALADRDQGEIVTVPSLPDKAEWDGFEAARRAMSPARRYNIRHPQSGAVWYWSCQDETRLGGLNQRRF